MSRTPVSRRSFFSKLLALLFAPATPPAPALDYDDDDRVEPTTRWISLEEARAQHPDRWTDEELVELRRWHSDPLVFNRIRVRVDG